MPRPPLAVALLLFAPLILQAQHPAPLKTTAEASDYKKTSTSAEVVAFCKELAKRSPLVRYSEYGTSGDGQPLPLLVLSDPPVLDPKKPVVFVTANIHAGEVDGKEAVLALARDLAFEKDSPLLKKLFIVIAPNLNPDGNDRMSEKNRTDQNGPPSVGVRTNAAMLDLNRDFVKLETPEIRGVVKLLNQFNPVLALDCHTTNGSYHRYVLTYDGPRLPAADPKLIALSQTKLQPLVETKVKAASGFDSFTYGDFDKQHEQWLTYGSGPRYGTQYYSLRGSVGVLSESYTYSSFADRIKASYAFTKANCEAVAENAEAVTAAVAAARKPRAKVALRTKTVARDKPMSVKGWVEETKDGKTTHTDTPKDYDCRILDKLEATLEVDRPAAYLIPAEYAEVARNLQRHGVVIEELREQVEVDAEQYMVTEFKQEGKEFQKHKPATVEAKAGAATVKLQPGTFVVRTEQPLGMLAAYLLEPQAEDGLTTWNFFDAGIKVGQPFPVLRLKKDVPLLTGQPRPLADGRSQLKTFGIDMAGGGPGAGFGGNPLGDITWLDDEHWLQPKRSGVWKVAARTGRAEPFLDFATVQKSLAPLDLDPREASNLLGGGPRSRYTFNADRSAVLFNTRGGLIVAYRDGRPAVRLTKAGKDDPPTEFASFSPDGKFVAYVQSGNLFAADVAGTKIIPLTTDGGKDEVVNGRGDWVYEEEIFNRNGQAYWWSPDSKAVAFLRFDDKKVPKFTLTSQDGRPEAISYPKSGATNPTAKVGVVTLAEPKPVYLDPGAAKPDSTLFSRVGWVPGPKPVPFAYVQDRTQTWLDFTTWPDLAGKPTVLFRDTTKAWVEDLGEPKFLKDGTFLILSERTGRKHLYRYAADGKPLGAVTEGDWDVKAVERIDEASGDVYFTCNKVRSTGTHLALVTLGKPDVQVISAEATSHRVEMAPGGTLYVDRQTDDATPTQAVLRELFNKQVRVLDTNPVYEREQYRWGKYERATIKTKDGFDLEAALTYPPDFHPLNRYPIWVLTYAGPHAPTIRDGWGTGRVFEQVLAASGVVVLRVDPRSASGKGAQSSWACYKQFGVQELRDLEEAVDWVCANPWADARRVGISGHSYGGYMAAYALTHGSKFTAGIAGAPVTDWALYDSFYTERYMGLPTENKAGYAKSSVVAAAANLHGRLLICYGQIDDNVHPQNSLHLIDALQKAGKEFEVMVYPTFRHGILTPHYPRSQVQFVRKVFGLEK